MAQCSPFRAVLPSEGDAWYTQEDAPQDVPTKAEPLALVDAERDVKVEQSEEAEAMRALEAALDGEPMTGDGEIEAPDAAEEAGDDGEPHVSPKSVPNTTVLNEVGVRCYTCAQEVYDVKSFRILNKGAGHLRCGVCNVRVVQLSRGSAIGPSTTSPSSRKPISANSSTISKGWTALLKFAVSVATRWTGRKKRR